MSYLTCSLVHPHALPCLTYDQPCLTYDQPCLTSRRTVSYLTTNRVLPVTNLVLPPAYPCLTSGPPLPYTRLSLPLFTPDLVSHAPNRVLPHTEPHPGNYTTLSDPCQVSPYLMTNLLPIRPSASSCAAWPLARRAARPLARLVGGALRARGASLASTARHKAQQRSSQT